MYMLLTPHFFHIFVQGFHLQVHCDRWISSQKINKMLQHAMNPMNHKSMYNLLLSVQVFDSHMINLFIATVLLKPQILSFSRNVKNTHLLIND